MNPSNTPDQYAVFGNPVSHSKSPLIHMLFAKQTHQDIVYRKQLVEHGKFSMAASSFFAGDGKGLNITTPFKQDAFDFSDEVSARAQLAGAVNTLKKMPDGIVFGDNTDGYGLVQDIMHNLKWPINDKRILVLGAGGAVRGILGPLLTEKPNCIVIANRTTEKASALAALFKNPIISACGYTALAGESFDLIINGTSASLSNELPPVHNSLINPATHCYDMMYGSTLTVFLTWAKNNGCQYFSDGLGMLVEQAAESFYLWRNIRPRTGSVIAEVRRQL